MNAELMPVPTPSHEQADDCHFYEVEGKYGLERWPVDRHAVYTYVDLGGYDIPVRTALRDVKTAIRALRPGDRVRLNEEGGWYEVTEETSEGAALVKENGHVEYELWAHHVPMTMGSDAGPRLFRRDGFSSMGMVDAVEVEWRDRE